MPLTSRLYRRIDTLEPEIKDVLLDLVDEMDHSVKKEDFNELKSVVADLAEAQKRTEERLDSLIGRVEELAEAQKRTEESLNKLIKRVDTVEIQLGGLSMAVGYGIEDKLYPHLRNFVAKEYGVMVHKVTLRNNVIYSKGKFDEINLYIEAIKGQKDILIVGECKAQPGKKDIDKFINVAKRLKEKFKKEVYPFIVGYAFNPGVEEYIAEKYPDLRYFKTYQIEHGEIS